MNLSKLAPTHVRKVLRARKRWARLTVEDRVGVFVRRWPMYGTAAAELGHLIGKLKVDCVVDVGAHRGGFGRLVRRLGFAGDIISFEPATNTFDALRRATWHDDRWTIHRLALGRLAGEGGPVDVRPTEVGEDDVVRLDDVWDRLVPQTRRVLLKDDAQGFDVEVLKGAEDSLARCVALQVEVSGVALYEGSPPLHEVVTHLYDRGFRITGLSPIMRNRPTGCRSSTSMPPSCAFPLSATEVCP